MAIEIEDYWLIKNFCEKYHITGNLLILGDCYYHFNHKDIKIEKKDTIQKDVFINILGFNSVDTIDIQGTPTLKFDLTLELPKILENKYDFIIDAGTLCCCFNVPAVLKNLNFLLKEEGYILHISYFSGFFGRGYYSFQPNFYQDYYKINNYDLNYLGIREKNIYSGILRRFFLRKFLWREMDINSRYFNGVDLYQEQVVDPIKIRNNMTISALAKKNKKVHPIFPIPMMTEKAR